MTKKILIVRSSSLGDLIFVLPAISDIAKHCPEVMIDWVVEESFADIPAWHPAVHQVIPISHRRWRKHWWSRETRRERAAFRKKLRQTHYDMVLDMQGLMKSVWVVRQAIGERHGLDWKSARERLASLFYHQRHRVDFWQPAVTRQRELAALALGYQYEGAPDFGLQAFTEGVEIQNYAVVMPSASRDDKLWPEEDWHAALDLLVEHGLELRVLAGNDKEAARAAELVKHYPKVTLLTALPLKEVAHQLAAARLMIGLDSGLTHLSAALGRPTIGIYCASTPVRTPLTGAGMTASLGDRGVPPSREVVLLKLKQALGASEESAADELLVEPAES
ncbi:MULTISPECIES: lipopolysaccharide heptosyltransferase I [Oligella]|uniref:Lipopolysaccharide heptosyltransferase 1 n=2 Tax=Oligella urethralis TaxID=90245 RepID=A0A096BB73_9BURK|nr:MULTISPECIES: lipopolysaccharide heptosyltransferase I [Oligella]KGF30419.1 heptosyltransferase [Oligella urethralis DNF00040]MDK6203085.1 lipopolysaccharide heptosyltransferase I [Oligella urethralis]OFS89532.1 lipopolysaccharide heptosyltransferase I [Oligella sp. HMSC05A10]OFV48759.1 lipopolysaccharide heptosyltransferase I [Oligella sp. HMSC09E12]WOS38459.1 Lipopolysaccharide heptosyltransferase 1 [Oligella urethralis]